MLEVSKLARGFRLRTYKHKGYPNAMGSAKVKNPKTRLFL
jgi:hypothetical protein